MKKIELLSPAPSKEAILPAVRLGASAVYLGLKEFSARRKAKNFDRKELKETIEYCHIRDVKVYLTVNILIKDEEIDNVIEIIKYAVSVNIDAVIVQDVGLAYILRHISPNLRLHGSTQMSIHTPAGAKMLENMGFSRVVLARELSFNEIKEIRNSCNIELEVFVHGALCMCVSGQCYLSSMIGGRSGNRGLCAQPCRLPFGLKNDSSYDLSLKDLSIIQHINELSEIGVNSIKIEGRMKRPEYVAAAVKACRTAIDTGIAEKEDLDLLKSVFSRSGFTDGYYKGTLGKSMFGIRLKEDVTSATNSIFSKLHEMYKTEKQTIPIFFDIKIKRNLPIELKTYDNDGNIIEINGPIPQDAINIVVDETICKKQLKKTGKTPFLVKDIFCEIDSNLSIPISQINLLRRESISKLEEKRKDRKPITFSNDYKNLIEHNSNLKNMSPKLRARFPDCNIPKEFKKCELVYIPLNSKKKDLIDLKENGFNLGLEIPRVFFGKEKSVIKSLEVGKSIGIKHVWVGNIGAIKIAKDLGFKIHGGFSLNLMNTYSMQWAKEIGFDDVETSFEMNIKQISDLKSDMKKGIIAYGRLPLMITRNCPAKNENIRCDECKKNLILKDRKGIKFPLVCSYDTVEILNSLPLCIDDKIKEIKGIEFTVLRFSVENHVENVEKLKSFHNPKNNKIGTTKGLYYRNVD